MCTRSAGFPANCSTPPGFRVSRPSEQFPVQLFETGDLLLLVKVLLHARPSRSSHPFTQIGIPGQPFEAVGKCARILGAAP